MSLRDDLALGPGLLRRRVDPAALPFETTAEVEPLATAAGQPRALEAIALGLDVGVPGYNLFVSGASGSGRTTTVRDHLERVAATRPTPCDWVVVHDVAEPDRPRTIGLPAGRGAELARAMDELVAAAQREIPRAFESDEYEHRRRAVLADVGHRRETLIEELQAFARERGFAVEQTMTGIASIPLHLGRPLSTDQFERLPAEERQQIEARGNEIQEHVAETMRGLRRLEKETMERVAELDREVARYATGPLFHDVRDQFADEPAIVAHLDALEADVPTRLGDFRPDADGELPGPLAALQSAERGERLARYRVNVLIDRTGTTGAPVVYERNPTYVNLMGRVEYRAAFGTMVTDFRQIRPGAIHRANGGFLLLRCEDVLRNPFSWEALKRALLAAEARIENVADAAGIVPSATLRPEPIPLDVKVVLIGSPLVYSLLHAYDEDFRGLFKVRADFAPDMRWEDEGVAAYAALAARHVRENGLRHLDRGAVARLVEHGGRLREDQRRLSTRLLELADVVTEASYWAGQAGHELVGAADVDRAIERRRYRSSLVEERVQELIAEGTLAIATDGERVGQVNGLSVLDLGDHDFGRPTRVSARVGLGDGSVTSVEREIELSGPIHSKGVLILAGYLTGTYAQGQPLAVRATLTFEQSYDEVEGDSASSTELYAVLSALADAPLRQGIAVTGSVDQHGAVQAVGGVCAKIEGFFDVCAARGLTGEQGVVLPAANVPHLMLRDDVVAAVERGDFHVWAVSRVDEGIELLTGVPAGEPDEAGAYPEGTIHARVAARLAALAEAARAHAEHADPPPEEPPAP
ncbi:MAG: ATP-binding protein [Thermoleophilia bacterium]